MASCKTRSLVLDARSINGKVTVNDLYKTYLIDGKRQATHLCIRGSRSLTSRMSHCLQWEDGARLSLFYHVANNKQVSKLNKRFQAENS